MKLITAYIQPARLPAVKKELLKRNIIKMSVVNAAGCGEERGYTEIYRGRSQEGNMLARIRFEIAVKDEFAQPAIDGIIDGSHSGNTGDGIIFVTEIKEFIHIRSSSKKGTAAAT